MVAFILVCLATFRFFMGDKKEEKFGKGVR